MSSTKNHLHKAFGVDVAAHGDSTSRQLDLSQNLEVISLGLSRTGTTSLQMALDMLGFGPCHGGVELFRSPARNEAFIDIYIKVVNNVWKPGNPALTDRLRNLMRGYRSCTDTPLCYLGPETYAAFPEAKFILTVRPGGADVWFKSLMEAAGWHFRSDVWRSVFRSLIWPVAFLRRTDDKVQLIRALWIKKFGAIDAGLYDKHNDEIKRIVPSEKLLEYDVRQGWEPLCEFLEVPVPSRPFPNLNDTKAMQSMYFGFMAFGAFTWAMYLGTAAATGYLALNPVVARRLLQGAASRLSDVAARPGWRL